MNVALDSLTKSIGSCLVNLTVLSSVPQRHQVKRRAHLAQKGNLCLNANTAS